jgi:hypothetical protein
MKKISNLLKKISNPLVDHKPVKQGREEFN